MSEEKYKDEEWLREKYHEENLSQRDISELCGVARKTIGRWMDRLDISVRDLAHANSVAQQNCSGKHRNKTWLREKYVNDEESLSEMGEMCGCNHETARTWLHKFDIDLRKPWEKRDLPCDGLHRKEEWLHKVYIVEQMNASEAASVCGCTQSTILEWLERNNIEKRSLSESILDCDMKHTSKEWLIEKRESGMSIQDMADKCGCSSSPIKRHMNMYGIDTSINLECDGRHRDLGWLKKNYIEKDKNMEEMASICGCTQSAISDWLNKYDVDTETGLFSPGDDHWNYKHGKTRKEVIDFRYQDEWLEFSTEKKEEVGWICEYCGNTNCELHTHHVEPVGMGGDEWDNDFIVLCSDCHFGNYGLWHPPQLSDYI
jgi:transposase/AraC-like DNA-binding protein